VAAHHARRKPRHEPGRRSRRAAGVIEGVAPQAVHVACSVAETDGTLASAGTRVDPQAQQSTLK